jgi:hypothetical protein
MRFVVAGRYRLLMQIENNDRSQQIQVGCGEARR